MTRTDLGLRSNDANGTRDHEYACLRLYLQRGGIQPPFRSDCVSVTHATWTAFKKPLKHVLNYPAGKDDLRPPENLEASGGLSEMRR
jgi:hypothetical protein